MSNSSFGNKNRNRGPQIYVGEHSGQELNRELKNPREQNNYSQGIHEESDFSFGSDCIQDARAYRPSRMSRQTGSRSWIGVGDSSSGGDQGGRSYSSNEYNENPSYIEDSSGGEYSGGQRRPSFAGRGPQGYIRSDERIREDVNDRLTWDHDVDASDISVESKDGEVVLKGTVTDRDSKRRAEVIAESCSGVKDVQNQIRIKNNY